MFATAQSRQREQFRLAGRACVLARTYELACTQKPARIATVNKTPIADRSIPSGVSGIAPAAVFSARTGLSLGGRLGLLAALVLAPMGATLAATAPDLGTATTFGVVSDTFTNSNTSPQTIIDGDVCFTTGPVTPPLSITGATLTPCPPATGVDQGLALANLNGQAPCLSLGAGAVALDTVIIGANPPGVIPPGCYSSGGAMDVTVSTTVTLDGPGVYIFRPGGALTTGADSTIVLGNGACASDVFWAPAAGTTIGANATLSVTPTFVGSILDAAGISLGHFANLNGRALAFGGTVTTDANTITVPTCAGVNSITIVKNTVGADGAFDFTSSTLTPGAFTINTAANTGTQVFRPLLVPGVYDVAETVPAGWNLTSATCSDGSPVNAINLADGEAITCTFTNTEIIAGTGAITIVKNTIGGDGAFDFSSATLAPSPFTITTVANTGSQNFTALVAAVYDVAETVPAGWNLTSASCSDGSPINAINLADGEAVTCTFTNTQVVVGTGSITIVKNTIGGNGAFDFTSATLVPSPFTITTVANTGSQNFTALVAGVYGVAETVPFGWNLTGATCSDGSPVNAINLAAGEAVTCTFTNQIVAAPIAVPGLGHIGLLILLTLMLLTMALVYRRNPVAGRDR